MKSGSLNLPEPSGPDQGCNGIALPLPLYKIVHHTDIATRSPNINSAPKQITLVSGPTIKNLGGFTLGVHHQPESSYSTWYKLWQCVCVYIHYYGTSICSLRTDKVFKSAESKDSHLIKPRDSTPSILIIIFHRTSILQMDQDFTTNFQYAFVVSPVSATTPDTFIYPQRGSHK